MSEDGKKQIMMMRQEIGDNYENVKAKVVSYTTNKTEQTRGEQKETQVHMEVDHVSGSEPEEEDWRDVDMRPKEDRYAFIVGRWDILRSVNLDVRTMVSLMLWQIC